MKTHVTLLKEVEENWPLRKGKNELLDFLKGKEITRAEAMLAMCYQCCGGYEGSEGGYDCQGKYCPLYLYMPFKKTKKAKTRVMSEEHKAKLMAGKKAKAKDKK